MNLKKINDEYHITVSKDGDGYLAVVDSLEDDLYAYDYTEKKAIKGLYSVIEMLMDIHLEALEKERRVKAALLKNYKDILYAV
ncbi:hypothetical protein HON22_01025 [Candidatus Peregrinibacteria bacterium]|jgi:hypothetical protein|nr:hypothetical protein [Candidatus Peregrinibacteria bacterium]